MKILLLEDNRVLAKSLVKGLKQEGFVVESFLRGDDGLKFLLWHHENIDILILDLMLPGISGEEICTQIRSKKINTPIIMLTAKGEVEDKVRGLNLGADDYLTKPFEFDELVARINALLRRQPEVQKEIIKLSKNVVIDMLKKEVYKNQKPKTLSPKEFAILEFLVKNRGQALNREQIFNKVMDFAADNWSDSIDVHIKNIRKKLFKDEKYDPIKTIRGIGYRLDAIE